MKELVDWVLARRYAVIALAVIFAPNLSFVSAGLLALQTAYRGPVVAIGDALLAALGVAFVTLLAGGPQGMPVAAVIALVIGIVVGTGIRFLRSLTLCFQAIVLCLYVGVLVYTLFGSTTNLLFDTTMDQFVELADLQGVSAGELTELRARQPRLVGVFAISIFLDLTAVLMLSFWWLGIAREEVRFGEQFRALRLGYVLGLPGALICLGTLVFESALVHNLFGVAACGFLVQGLAYSHQWVHARERHPAYLLPLYVLVVPAFLVFSLFAVLGFSPS